MIYLQEYPGLVLFKRFMAKIAGTDYRVIILLYDGSCTPVSIWKVPSCMISELVRSSIAVISMKRLILLLVLEVMG